MMCKRNIAFFLQQFVVQTQQSCPTAWQPPNDGISPFLPQDDRVDHRCRGDDVDRNGCNGGRRQWVEGHPTNIVSRLVLRGQAMADQYTSSVQRRLLCESFQSVVLCFQVRRVWPSSSIVTRRVPRKYDSCASDCDLRSRQSHTRTDRD